MSRLFGCQSAYCQASLGLDELRTHAASQHHDYAPFVCRALGCASGGPPSFPTRVEFVAHMVDVHKAGGVPVPFVYKEKARKERAVAADVNRAIAASVRASNEEQSEQAGHSASAERSRMSPDTTREDDVVDVAAVPLPLANVHEGAEADRRRRSARRCAAVQRYTKVPTVSPCPTHSAVVDTVETCGGKRSPTVLLSAIERASTHRNARAPAGGQQYVRRSSRASKSTSRASSVATTAMVHCSGYDIDNVRRIYFDGADSENAPTVDGDERPSCIGMFPEVELLSFVRKLGTVVNAPGGQFKERKRCATCTNRDVRCVCRRAFHEDGPI